jgi:hypothetical protein
MGGSRIYEGPAVCGSLVVCSSASCTHLRANSAPLQQAKSEGEGPTRTSARRRTCGAKKGYIQQDDRLVESLSVSVVGPILGRIYMGQEELTFCAASGSLWVFGARFGYRW